jgi:hypothetical protein
MEFCARLITDIWLPFESDIRRQALCPMYDYQSQRPVSTGFEAPTRRLFSGGMWSDWQACVAEPSECKFLSRSHADHSVHGVELLARWIRRNILNFHAAD